MKNLINGGEQHLKNKGKASSTIKLYREVVNNALSKGDSNLENFELLVEEYAMSIIGLKDTTISTRMYAIDSFQEGLIREDHLSPEREIDIAGKFIPNKKKKVHVKIITPGQQKKLFDACLDPRDKLAFLILLKTGVRISEFTVLDDVDLLIKNEFISVSGKSISSRDIFIAKEIKELAIKVKEEFGSGNIGPNSYTGRDKRLKSIANMAGLELNLHMFRATFATEGVYKGHSLIQLQQAMGHSSLSQLEVYVQKNQLELKRAGEEFSTGIDYFDVEFLKAENKHLKERLKKYE